MPGLGRRTQLRRAAIRYTERGWPVVPGAVLGGCGLGRYPAQRRFDCGQRGCRTIACHPALPEWERQASNDRATVEAWWANRAYTVLLATGHAFDVLEVPTALARAALLGDGSIAARGPVAVAPGGRWMFWVRPGHGILPELAGRSELVLHGRGSWVPAPPSPQFGGRVRWELPPERHEWRPAQPYALQALIIDAIRNPGMRARRAPACRHSVDTFTNAIESAPIALRYERFTRGVHAGATVAPTSSAVDPI